MSSKTISAAVIGLEAEIVEVEADTGGGDLGSFTIVGLPDAAVQESRSRVRSAIKNSGVGFPKIKVTVNLAPADLKKQGPSYDLPIAISVLTVKKIIKDESAFSNSLFVGELALNGDLRSINGVLSIAASAKAAGINNLFVPAKNAPEANLIKGISVYPVKTLKQLIQHLNHRLAISPIESRKFDFSNTIIQFDMAHVKGQEHVKRAMEITAAGGHNMMMGGPPGSGKTLIARTMPSILPDLNLEEALEITKIYSVAGYLPPGTALVTCNQSIHRIFGKIAYKLIS